MLRIFLISSLLFGSGAAVAHEAKSRKHKAKHSHGAHVHGVAQLAVAFDGAKGTLELRAPSESIYGFEHEPKDDKQKAALDGALAMLESHLEMMVQFPAGLSCKFTKEKLGVERESPKSKHAETVAVFAIACDKSPAGAQVNIGVHEHFPNIKTLKATFVLDSMQKSMDVTGTTTVQL
jgi:hypothetical protein